MGDLCQHQFDKTSELPVYGFIRLLSVHRPLPLFDRLNIHARRRQRALAPDNHFRSPVVFARRLSSQRLTVLIPRPADLGLLGRLGVIQFSGTARSPPPVCWKDVRCRNLRGAGHRAVSSSPVSGSIWDTDRLRRLPHRPAFSVAPTVLMPVVDAGCANAGTSAPLRNLARAHDAPGLSPSISSSRHLRLPHFRVI